MSLKDFFDPTIRLGRYNEWKASLQETWSASVAPLPKEEPAKIVEEPATQKQPGNAPLYKHNCTECKFLVSYMEAGKTFDLYCCNNAGLLIRWSDGLSAHEFGYIKTIRDAIEDRTINKQRFGSVFIVALSVYDKLRKEGSI